MTVEYDLVAYLTSKGLQVHRAAGDEITVNCISCGETKRKGKLYFNTQSWLGQCKICLQAWNRKTLLEFYGDEEEARHEGGVDPSKRLQILKEAAALAHSFLLENDEKLQYLLDRGVDPELIERHKLGYVPKNVGFSDMLPSRESFTFRDLIAAGLVVPANGGREFFNDCITIPYHSHGSVVQIRAKFIDGKYLTAGGDQVRLWNADALHGATDVLVVEGEFDEMAVESALLAAMDRDWENLAIVGLPGAGAWPEGFIDRISACDRVFIGLDPDETGKKAAAKMKTAVGMKARIVNLPSGEPKTDWTDFLKPKSPSNPNGGHRWSHVRDLLIEADLAGKQMFSIEDAYMRWTRQRNEAPGLELGWPQIDSRIRPGIQPGQLVIPLANTGAGKSVFLSNITYNLRKKHVLYLSLELTVPQVYEHLRRIHKFWNPEAGERDIFKALSNVRIVDQNRLKPGDIEALIAEYSHQFGVGPDVVIVDYLQYYARGFRASSQHERVNEAVMDAKAQAKAAEAVFILPSQVNRGAERGKPLTLDAARDSGVIEETADIVMSLWRPDQQILNPETGERPIQNGHFSTQILKSRNGSEGAKSDLRMSLLSLVIVDKVFDQANALRVEQENSAYRRGMNYDDFRKAGDAAITQQMLGVQA